MDLVKDKNNQGNQNNVNKLLDILGDVSKKSGLMSKNTFDVVMLSLPLITAFCIFMVSIFSQTATGFIYLLGFLIVIFPPLIIFIT